MYGRQLVLGAEIKVYCIQSREQAVVQELEKRIKAAESPMFTDYLNTEYPCEYYCKCYQDSAFHVITNISNNNNYANDSFKRYALTMTRHNDCRG